MENSKETFSENEAGEKSLLGRYGTALEIGEGGRTGDIVAIVVTYNRKEKLQNCLNALFKQKGGRPDILVIDNASDDGTKEALKDLADSEKIIYKNTGRNLGGAGGFEIGVREAVTMGYKYLWLMDDDSVPDRKALMEFKRAHNKLSGRYGFLSGKVLWKDGNICKMNIQKKDVLTRIPDFNKDLEPIQFASFVSCFIRASVVREVALPIGEFFIWGDDHEYTRRISMEYPCYYVKKSVVVHDRESNTGSDIAQDSLDKMKCYLYSYRNDVYIFRREGIRGWTYLFARLIYHVLKIAVSGESGKRIRFATLFKGTLMGLLYNPTVDLV